MCLGGALLLTSAGGYQAKLQRDNKRGKRMVVGASSIRTLSAGPKLDRHTPWRANHGGSIRRGHDGQPAEQDA